MSITLLSLALSMGASASTVAQNIMDKIQQGLNEGPSRITVHNVETTPIAGVYKVTTEDNKSFYSSANGQFIISGKMFEVDSGQVTEIGEIKARSKRIKLVKEVQDKDTIIYPAQGTKKHRLTVFTDVDCPYCAKLHKEIPSLNNMGVELVYLAFPRAGIDSPSFSKIASVWCSSDPKVYLEKTQRGEFVKLLDCDDSVIKNQFILGNKLSIQGTPSIVFEDGRIFSGYHSASELKKLLAL
jgi:thiol:disulfide interchange protein DsbC